MGVRRIALVFIGLVLACGGRSNLQALGDLDGGEGDGGGLDGGGLDGAGPVGDGGSPDGAGGDGGASSSGGAGGPPVVPSCSALSVAWGPVFVSTPGLAYISTVQLTPIGGGAVALTVQGAAENGLSALDHGLFEPWGDGEPELSALKALAGSMSHLAFAAPSDADGRYALFYQPGWSIGPMTFVPALDPGAAYAPYPPGIELPLAPAAQMAFAAWPSGGHVVLFRTAVGPEDTVLGAGIFDGSVGPLATSTSGCGGIEAAADVVALDDETGIVAMVSDAEAGTCPQTGSPSTGVRLQTGTLDRNTAAISIEEDREQDGSLKASLTRRSDGAWLITERAEPGNNLSPPLSLQRLDRRGAYVGEELELPAASDIAGLHREVAWGDGLAVAADNPSTDAEPTAGLWLVDAQGALVDTEKVEAPARINAPVAVGVSPALDAFLVAFPSTLPNPSVGLVRFDCMP